MSIRKLSMLFSGGVAAVVIGAAMLAILTEVRRLNTSIKVGDATQIISYLNKATVELSFERSLSQVGLALPSAFPQRFNDILIEQRRKSDKLFDTLQGIVATTGLPKAGEFAQALQRERSELAQLRQAIDPDLARPAAERAITDSGVIDRLKASVIKIKDLGDLLRPDASELPSMIAAHDLLMQRAWIIREFGGRERTHFAIATATGQPVPDASLPEMYEAHGRVIQSWDLTARLMLRTAFNPEIKTALETLKRAYFEEYQSLRREMYAGARSGTFPVDFETYFARSSAALDAAVAVVLRAGEANVKLAAAMKREAQWKLLTIIAVSVVALALVGLLVRFFLVRIAGRIVAVTSVMRRLADGHFDVDLAPFAGRDEVGDMVQAIGVFRDNAIARRTLETQTVADRNKELQRQDRLEELVSAFRDATNRIQESLATDMQSMKQAAGELSAAGQSAAQESDKAMVSSRGMDQSMQSIGAVVGELSRAVQELAGHAQATREIVARAIGVAAQTKTNVTSLSSAADRIGTVVNLIRAIAGQTNLLALNATIEAARAGEAGKGFAVVAAEVKSLAMQTARATDEIEQHVGGIQTSTSDAVESIASITATIDDIADLIKALTGAVEFQETAARSIGLSITNANADSRTVAHGLSHVGETIAKTNEQAQLVNIVSTQVGTLSDELARTVHAFLEGVAEDVNDRRKEFRMLTDDPVEVLTPRGSFTCRLVDICQTGMKIALDRHQVGKVKKDDVVTVTLKDGTVTKAAIVWLSNTNAGLKVAEGEQTFSVRRAA